MSPFPRSRDDKPHAWGLTHENPIEIWERFSPAYEAQAETLWAAFRQMGLEPALEWAGSEDGEAIIGREASSRPGREAEIVVLFHLENPDEAMLLQKAIATDRLAALIEADIRETEAAAARARAEDAARPRRRGSDPEDL